MTVFLVYLWVYIPACHYTAETFGHYLVSTLAFRSGPARTTGCAVYSACGAQFFWVGPGGGSRYRFILHVDTFLSFTETTTGSV